MKGLLLKEFYFLSEIKRLIFVFILVGFITVLEGGTQFLTAYFPFMVMMTSFSSFNYDEHYKWDSYALTLPLKRSTIVLSKYIYCLILMSITLLITLLISCGTQLFFGEIELVETAIVLFLDSIIFIAMYAIQIPFYIQFGAVKARYIVLGVMIGIGVLGGWMISALKGALLLNKIIPVLENHGLLIGMIGLIIAILMLIISYFISKKIYLKKEF